MVTEEMLCAVQGIIENLKTSEQRYAGKIIFDMLSDYDEIEWSEMDDKEQQEWLNKYINKR